MATNHSSPLLPGNSTDRVPLLDESLFPLQLQVGTPSHLFFLNFSFSLRLETGIFDGRPADYFFMLIVNLILSVIIALGLRFYVLMDLMVMSVLYVWCQINKDTIVNFWFGTQFKAMYLPWVLFGFKFIIGGKIIQFYNDSTLHCCFPHRWRSRGALRDPDRSPVLLPDVQVPAGLRRSQPPLNTGLPLQIFPQQERWSLRLRSGPCQWPAGRSGRRRRRRRVPQTPPVGRWQQTRKLNVMILPSLY